MADRLDNLSPCLFALGHKLARSNLAWDQEGLRFEKILQKDATERFHRHPTSRRMVHLAVATTLVAGEVELINRQIALLSQDA